MFFSAPSNGVISVSILIRLARELMEKSLPVVWISGELSNVTLAASGHAYFSLKDHAAQVRCVMFRHRLAQLSFKPTEGAEVELKGLVTLYEARGEFQINVETMRTAGIGQWLEAFEHLKTRLALEGLFDVANKQPLPPYPKTIGVITSPIAAALRDVVTTLKRRMPSITVIVYPTAVQGENAIDQIDAAIRLANKRQEVDVLLLCRGGGSIEDLWSFNNERVARAVALSSIPIVSGIGHETDFTICDFVADQRAATPTAAAELASPCRTHVLTQINWARERLRRALARRLSEKLQHLDGLSHRLSHPGERLKQQFQWLSYSALRLKERITALYAHHQWQLTLARTRLLTQAPDLARHTQQLTQVAKSLTRTYQNTLHQKAQMLSQRADTLRAISPQAVLARGYAVVQKHNGLAVRSANELINGERVTLQLSEGTAMAMIEKKIGSRLIE